MRPALTCPAPQSPSPALSDYPNWQCPAGFVSDADLASLPSTLGGAMSIIPSFDGGIPGVGARRGGSIGPVKVAEQFSSPPATRRRLPFTDRGVGFRAHGRTLVIRLGARAAQSARELLFPRRGLERLEPGRAIAFRC